MIDILSFFSSQARLEVLKVLVQQTAPLPLRHIAALSGASLFSIQRALAQLVEEQVLIRMKSGPYVLFSLNEHHALYPFVIQFFDLERRSRLSLLAEGYREKAHRSLDFSRSGRKFFKGVKSWTSRHSSKRSSAS